jgi:hypothetical protein
MRISVTCIIALSVLAFGARSARAEEPIACTLELRLADVVALRSDGIIGVGNRTITDDKISYDWSSLNDYNADNLCNPYFNVGPDVIAMCQEFLAANAPDECPAELENTKKTVINQSKQIRRLARENKRLRDLLKLPRPLGQAKR